MLFTDSLFLFYFLPAALLLVRASTWGVSVRWWTKVVIVATTIVFYSYENWRWPLIFLSVVGWTYGCAWAISTTGRSGARRAWLVAGISGSLGLLALFKYLNWLTKLWPVFSPLRDWLAGPFGDGVRVILPPGISFYIFEAISFTVDEYRRRVAFPKQPLDYLTFLAMFPRFIAGPIVRYADVAGCFRVWPGMLVARGLTLFGIGFALKVCFADQFAVFVPYAFGTTQPDLLQAWVGALAYAFQLYFDFWGYSLMATGLGLCIGFQFPDNFRSPYHADSIGDFWRRWHITLSSWLRDYLYIPLGGSRAGRGRLTLNLVLTMGLGGLWHGADVTFLVWGLYHGILLAIEHSIGRERMELVPRQIRRPLTFFAVLAGWVLFRATSFGQAGSVLAGVIGINGVNGHFNPLLLEKHMFSVWLVLAGLLFCWRGERWLVRDDRPVAAIDFPPYAMVTVWLVFISAVFVNASSQSIPFLYFQF
jgi:alginate O-acetyltransferase complex protein AlgI